MPDFDRIDIVEAHYLFLSHYHEGAGSEKYRRLSRILTRFGFRARPNLSVETLTENGRAIYDELAYHEEGGPESAPREMHHSDLRQPKYLTEGQA